MVNLQRFFTICICYFIHSEVGAYHIWVVVLSFYTTSRNRSSLLNVLSKILLSISHSIRLVDSAHFAFLRRYCG